MLHDININTLFNVQLSQLECVSVNMNNTKTCEQQNFNVKVNFLNVNTSPPAAPLSHYGLTYTATQLEFNLKI